MKQKLQNKKRKGNPRSKEQAFLSIHETLINLHKNQARSTN
jgi:hypothetical protein